MLIMEISVHCI